jgi:hypothetical protein
VEELKGRHTGGGICLCVVGVGVEGWRRGEVAVCPPPHHALPRHLGTHDALTLLVGEGVATAGGTATCASVGLQFA